MGDAHRRSGRRALAMLISAQDDAHGQCSPALRTTRVGNAPRGRAFSFVANPRSLRTGWTAPKGSACSTTRRSRRLPRCLGLSLFMSVPSFTAARRYSTNKQKRRVRTHVRTPPVRMPVRDASDAANQPSTSNTQIPDHTRPWYCIAPSSPLIALDRLIALLIKLIHTIQPSTSNTQIPDHDTD